MTHTAAIEPGNIFSDRSWHQLSLAADGRILSTSVNLPRQLGFTPADFNGLPLEHIIAPAHHPRLADILVKLKRQLPIVAHPIRFRARNDAECDGELTLQTFQPDPSNTYFVGLLRFTPDGAMAAAQPEVGRRLADLSVIHEIAQASASLLDLPAILGICLDQLQQMHGYSRVIIALIDEETQQPEVAAARDYSPSVPGVIENETVSRVVDSGQPAVVLNLAGQPQAELLTGLASAAVVPIQIGRLVIGVLIAGSPAADAFGPASQQGLLAITSQLAVAIASARLWDRMQQHHQAERARREFADHLLQTARALSSTLDLEKVLDIILERLAQAVPYVRASIMLRRHTLLEIAAARGFAEDIRGRKIDCAPPSVAYALLHEQYSLSSDRNADNPHLDLTQFDLDFNSWLGVPLVARNNRIGLLTLDHLATGFFDESAQRIVHAFANHAAIAVENAQLYQYQHQKARQFEAVAQIGQQIAGIHTIDRLLEYVVTALHDELKLERVSIYLADTSEEVIWLRADSGAPQIIVEDDTHRLKFGQNGPVGQAAALRKPLRIGPDRPPTETRQWSEIAIPLNVADQTVGVLDVQSDRPDGFDDDTEPLLQIIGDQLAVAIENTWLSDERDQRLAELAAFNQIGLAVAGTRNLEETLLSIMHRVNALFQVEAASLLLLEGDTLNFAVAVGKGADEIRPFSLKLGEGLGGWVAQHRKPLRVNNVSDDPRHYRDIDSAINFTTRSLLAVPVEVQDRVLGVIETVNRLDNRPFNRDDEIILEFIASSLGIAIENTRLYQKTQKQLRALEALTRVSEAITKATDLQHLVDVVLDAALSLIGGQVGTIALVGPPSGAMQIVTWRGFKQKLIQRFNSQEIRQKDSPFGKTEQTTQIVEIGRQSDLTTPGSPGSPLDDFPKVYTAIPLISRGEFVGAVTLYHIATSNDTHQLLQALADMAAVAIDKAKLHAETEQRLAEVSTLYTLANQMTTELNLEKVLDTTVTILSHAMTCQGCHLFLLDPGREQPALVTKATNSWRKREDERAVNAFIETVVQRVITDRNPWNMTDTEKLAEAGLDVPSDIGSVLVVPLVSKSTLIGALTIYDKMSLAYGPAEGRLLSIAAAQVAVAIENARLFQDLHLQAEELEQALQDLQEASRLKSEFMQNVSHELRTPLTFVKGYIELFLEGAFGELNEEMQNRLTIVANRTSAVTRLVEDMLLLQQVEVGNLQFDWFDLADVVHLAAQAADVTAAQNQVKISTQMPAELPSVWGDAGRVGQIFDNLIGNAIKFSPEGGQIIIRVELLEDGFLKTSIQDTGIGIPAGKLDKIFSRFYQVDGSTTRRYGGTGLGLAIVRQIVEAHGGWITAESYVGQGSTFAFSLPTRRPGQE